MVSATPLINFGGITEVKFSPHAFELKNHCHEEVVRCTAIVLRILLTLAMHGLMIKRAHCFLFGVARVFEYFLNDRRQKIFEV